MGRYSLFPLLLLAFVVAAEPALRSQGIGTPAVETANPFRLKVTTNEVVLTFHAADASGRAVTDLKLDELGLYDNEKRPRQILAFEEMRDLPLRTGLLLDKSDSMERAAALEIADRYAREILREQSDEAFVMNFASRSSTVQPWTRRTGDLLTGLRTFVNVSGQTQGTAIFDAVYRACLNEFGHVDFKGSGNLILLFSDGEDNASRASLSEAVTACQHTSTMIYVFRPKLDGSSSGLRSLRELAEQTGGRVFPADTSAQEVDLDLATIEANLRNQYRLIYRPLDLKHDGAFHSVALVPPERVSSLAVRSGYYAPVR